MCCRNYGGAPGDWLPKDVGSSVREIAERYAKEMGVGISLVEVDSGRSITTEKTELVPIAQVIRRSDGAGPICYKSDLAIIRRMQDEFERSREPMVYQCWAGLTELCAPIICHDHLVAVAYTGQMLLADVDQDTKRQLQQTALSAEGDGGRIPVR